MSASPWVPADDDPWRGKIGRRELKQREDGRWNVWKFGFLFFDDLIPRWILIGVVRRPTVGG